jgi:hypothetical protein
VSACGDDGDRYVAPSDGADTGEDQPDTLADVPTEQDAADEAEPDVAAADARQDTSDGGDANIDDADGPGCTANSQCGRGQVCDVSGECVVREVVNECYQGQGGCIRGASPANFNVAKGRDATLMVAGSSVLATHRQRVP